MKKSMCNGQKKWRVFSKRGATVLEALPRLFLFLLRIALAMGGGVGGKGHKLMTIPLPRQGNLSLNSLACFWPATTYLLFLAYYRLLRYAANLL